MPASAIPVRIRIESHGELAFIKRELSAKYNRDYSFSDVIDALIHGYSPGNPKLAESLREIISRRPVRGIPESDK